MERERGGEEREEDTYTRKKIPTEGGGAMFQRAAARFVGQLAG